MDDPRGIRLELALDGLGRQVARRAYRASDGALLAEETLAYDQGGNLTGATNPEGTIAVTYDDAGRVDTVTFGTHATGYAYDRDRLQSRTDPAGTTAYGYDPEGRLSRVTDPFTGAPTALSYTPAGRLDLRTDPSGLAHDYAFDPAGRLASEVVTQGTTEVARFESAYDPGSHVTSRTRSVQGGPENGTWTYAYDDAGRLVQATSPDGVTTAYGYDGAGNRTSVQVGTQAAVTTAFDRAGRPTSSSDGTTYAHDPAGNLTRISGPGATWDYAWDPFDRMTSATKEGGPSLALRYDALDRLVQRTKDATATTTYAYAGTTEELVSETAATTTLYASILGEPLVQQRGTEVRFLGLDPHGDVAYLADPSGAPVGWRAYGPWGEVRQASGESSTLGFQGDPTDPDTGLVDMGARLYAPGLGRFTSPDLLRGEPPDPLSLNRFLYGEADPVSLVDPTGLRPAFCSGPGGACGGSSGSIRDHRRGMSWYAPKAQVRTTQSLSRAPAPSVRTYIRAVEDEVRRYVPRVQPRPRPEASRRARPADLRARNEIPWVTALGWTLTALSSSMDAGGVMKSMASRLGRLLRTSELPHVRSKVAPLLPRVGRMASRAGHPVVRVAGRALVVAGFALDAYESRRKGQGWGESLVRSGLKTGGTLGGVALVGAVCVTTGVLTAGVGAALLCGGGAVVAGVGGHRAGDEIGDAIYGED